MRALITDDSRSMRMIIGRIVKELGFDVAEAGNGLEALDQLNQQGPFDLALVDWNMPEMNGLEFVRAMRSNPTYDKIKVVMVTTETESTQVELALASGANEYVMKPFNRDVLKDKLALLGIN